jgi:hypothetical protein
VVVSRPVAVSRGGGPPLRRTSSFRPTTARSWVSRHRLRLALFACLLLLGFAAPFAVTAGSHAATRATTTFPKPDPPPQPPPPPTHTYAPPPPPSPPPPSPSPPAPPPPAAAITRPQATPPHRRVVRHHAHGRSKKTSRSTRRLSIPAESRRLPGMPGLRALAPTVLSGREVDSSSSSLTVPIVLGSTFGLSLVLVGLALMPLWVLPRPVRAGVYDRREQLLYSAVVIYATTGLSLVIALSLS